MPTTTPAPKKTKTKVTDAEVLSALLVKAVVKDSINCATIIRETCVNVFENKWRINLWVGINNPIVPNAGRILKSYFVKYGDCGLEILED